MESSTFKLGLTNVTKTSNGEWERGMRNEVRVELMDCEY